MRAFEGSVGMLLAVVAAACGGDTPSGPQGGGAPVIVEMDMHVGEDAVASATGPMLAVGQAARVKVEGTYSIWGQSMWNSGVCQGTSEPAPAFPSAGSSNGSVGVDAEYYFAVPSSSALCSKSYPWGAGEFKISLDGGVDFDNPDPIVPLTGPVAGHVYEYEVVGQGHPIMFERDDTDSGDNYGVLRITVTPN